MEFPRFPALAALAALILIFLAAGCAQPRDGSLSPEVATPAVSAPPTPPGEPPSPIPSLAAPVTAPATASTPGEAAGGKILFFFPWPEGEKRYLTTNFHEQGGLDFASFSDPDGPILAAANGTVVWAEYSHPDDFNTYPEGKGDLLDMGNSVILQHGPSTYTIYLHLRHEEAPPVRFGEAIPAGRLIGRQGDTGKSHGAHLHFGVVDLSFTPLPQVTGKPRESWGFAELNGGNTLSLNAPYGSENAPA